MLLSFLLPIYYTTPDQLTSFNFEVFAVTVNHRVDMKKGEKLDKYEDFAKEIVKHDGVSDTNRS